MPYVSVRHRVADYATWKRVVNGAKAWRKASGEKSLQVYRSSRNPNDLTIICCWDTTPRMQKFLKSAELRQRMMEAGVITKPEIQFFSKADDLSV
ncbi:MAG: cyclase [Verrucomicrobia bacterium]|nr:MAG: cyclase [Verrucomicrobiota bacterium]